MTEAEPPSEPFDPKAYPEEFTREHLGQMTFRDLILIEDNLDRLTDRQRETFQSARDEVMAPMKDVMDTAAARIARIAATRGTSALFMSDDLRRSMAGITSRFTAAAALAQSSGYQGFKGAGQLGPVLPKVTPPDPDLTPAQTQAVLQNEPVYQVVREVQQDAQQLAVLSSIRDLMERQHLSTTRGAFLAFIVSVSVIVAGVAPIVLAETWRDRLLIVVISAALTVAALVVYFVVRRKQMRTDTPPTTTDS